MIKVVLFFKSFNFCKSDIFRLVSLCYPLIESCEFYYINWLYFRIWDDLNWGIQRVDACRSEQGELLLVELEDLNPYLSFEHDCIKTKFSIKCI